MSNEVMNQADSYADEALLVLIAQKDAEAFRALYDRHKHPVFHLLVSITRDTRVAEELLQDTFWQVWQKANQFAESGSAAAWLTRIARNKALDHLRHRRYYLQVITDRLEDFDQVALFHHQSTEQIVELHLMHQHVAAALARLPNEQRHCLELAYFEGLSHSEIAAYTQLPLGTIKTRLRIGRDKVERWLRAVGFPESHAAYSLPPQRMLPSRHLARA